MEKMEKIRHEFFAACEKKVDKDLCKVIHAGVDSDIREIKADVAKINSKLWSGLVLITLQLLGVLVIFLKGCAR